MERKFDGDAVVMPESDHIVVKGIEVFFGRVVLNHHLREGGGGFNPELQGIEKQQHHQVKGKGVDGKTEDGKYLGKADGNHGHYGNQQDNPQVGAFRRNDKKASHRYGGEDVVKSYVAIA